MHLTLKTDYCLRVLIYLQTHQGKVKIQTIADAYGISKNHLSMAVNKLSELGYVLSMPGPKGGIELNPEIIDKPLAELVSQTEELNLVECFDVETNTCTLSPRCKLKKILHKATQAFVSELSRYKVKDLI